MTKEHNISVQKTARFFSLGCEPENAKQVWIVCHGYGHLAKYFIKHFSALANEESMVIAPEGLHRYYLEGASGRVGASWMTKEERESDIKDYIAFLNSVYKTVVKRDDAKVHVIGFSQGAATVSRWVAGSNYSFNSLILWAGMFPPDVDLNKNIEQLNKVKHHYLVMGKNDEYLSVEEFELQQKTFINAGLNVEMILFDGKHEVNKEALLKIAHHCINN